MTDPPLFEDSLEGSSSLDHVLLESLFYNEFAMMDESSDPLLVLPSLDLACTSATAPSDSNLAEGAVLAAESAVHAGESLSNTSNDPSVRVEKDLLRDFGVTSSPAPRLDPAANKTPVNLPTLPFVPSAPDVEQQVRNQIASCNRGIRHNVAVASAPLPARLPPPPKPPEPTEEEKRKKLVSQFATLANRLGITLPPPVLQKLTSQASSTGGVHLHGIDATSSALKVEPPISTSAANFSPPVTLPGYPRVPATQTAAPAIQQVQSTAAEAIASVSNKRPSVDDNRPYSKRRKKPRLPDCERKLAELKAENELLKRHLDNISNKSMALEKERIAAEQKMRAMLQSNAPDHELEQLVKNFAEMYSDYGRKRHEELNFHLEQLQRLANPTNFTKMGLWTLAGQSSSNGANPIAGLLQKELGISAQQGRKILEKRQKIRDVCSNLKELLTTSIIQCLVLLGKLRSLCEQKTKVFHDRLTKCREILTPKQVIKLLLWIDENSDMLGTVCPGWGSEQFQPNAVTQKSPSATS